MRSILLKIVSALVAPSLFMTVLAAGTRCRSSDFACFKRNMMPKVGRRITIVGTMSSAKLGWLVRFEDWGVYVYALHASDVTRMKALDSVSGQTVQATGTLGYSLGSSSPRTDAASVPEHFFFDVAEVKVSIIRPRAEMKFREMRFRKPPLVELYFDIVLRNDRPQPRWFLLPSNLGADPTSIAAKGGVDGVEVLAPQGKAGVIVGHFLGTGGFYALVVPARSNVHITSFPISYWGHPPDNLQVEVVAAKQLTIGGDPAASWLEVKRIGSARADIAVIPLDQYTVVRSKHTPDNKEVPTTIEVDRRFELTVRLRQK